MTPMNSIYVLEEIQRRAWNMGGDEPSMHVVTGSIHDNPSLTEEGKRQIMAGWDASEREAREFGHFLHLVGRVFPEFCHAHEYDESVYDPLCTPDEHGKPSKEASDAPVMCIIDPHLRRRWVIQWIAVDKEDQAWVVREWPTDYKDVAKAIDYGGDGVFLYMAKVIQSTEATMPGGSARVIWREMDPNMGNSPAQGSGYDTVSRALRAAGEKLGMKLAFRTDVSDSLEQGYAALRNLLAYDATQPDSFGNHPKYRVNTKCRATLWAFHNHVWDNWSDETKAQKEKPKEIGKDYIDTSRYFAMRHVRHVDWRSRHGSVEAQIRHLAAAARASSR